MRSVQWKRQNKKHLKYVLIGFGWTQYGVERIKKQELFLIQWYFLIVCNVHPSQSSRRYHNNGSTEVISRWDKRELLCLLYFIASSRYDRGLISWKNRFLLLYNWFTKAMCVGTLDLKFHLIRRMLSHQASGTAHYLFEYIWKTWH